MNICNIGENKFNLNFMANKAFKRNSAANIPQANAADSFVSNTTLKAGDTLPKNQPVVINTNSKLHLSEQYTLDLNSKDIRTKLDKLKEGEYIVVGRSPKADILINNKTVSRQHLIMTKQNGRLVIYDTSSNGTKIASGGVRNLDELSRNSDNAGNILNNNYINNQNAVRNFLNNAIDSSLYTQSPESYIYTVNTAHRLAYGGFRGEDLYYTSGSQLLSYEEAAPGKIRGAGTLINSYHGKILEEVEQAAIKYNDPFRIGKESTLYLKGIEGRYLPKNNISGYAPNNHLYPDGAGLNQYFAKMYQTSCEALNLIKNNASEIEILKKIAEHYQYAINARPYNHINNSVFMNELNTLLEKAGLGTIPHRNLDHIAQRLQPEAFSKYFTDFYIRNCL